MPEFARRCYPATLRLKELLATTLGAPRLILGNSRLFGFDRYAVPGPTTQIAPAALQIDPGSYLLDWCSFLMQALPVSISGSRCYVVPDPGRVRLRARFRELRGRLPRRRLRPDRIRPLRPPAAGERRADSCRPRGSRCSRNAEPPGSRCPSGSSGGTRPARTRRGCPWSPRWAMCSTTNSTGWSTRVNRWPPRSTTPWRSRGWSRT